MAVLIISVAATSPITIITKNHSPCEILNTNPAIVYISVRPERFSHKIISENKEFVINLTNEKLAYATDWCGVRSGAKFDKFKEMKLTKEKANFVKCPLIKESPVSIECRVIEETDYGRHPKCTHLSNDVKCTFILLYKYFVYQITDIFDYVTAFDNG